MPSPIYDIPSASPKTEMTKEEREELEAKAALIAAQHRFIQGIPEPAPTTPQRVIIVNEQHGFVLFCWVVVLLACGIAAIVLFLSIGAQGAPQQAAGAAIACALVILPYAFTRAIEGLLKR